ncbi:MAG: hypothetical protein ACTSR8_09415 [Promethearchaeota archaeon]
MTEKEHPLSPEEIEEQKKMIKDLQASSRDNLIDYMKNTQKERKENIEKSKEQISGLIADLSFIREKRREQDYERIELKPDLKTSADLIKTSVGEKAFLIDQKRIKDAERLEIKPDIKGLGEKIQKLISDKLFLINQKRAKDEERLQIKPNLEQVANKIESLIRDKIFYALKSKESLKPYYFKKERRFTKN